MTFDQMVAIDPRLRELEYYVRIQRASASERQYWTRWEEMKRHLTALVGWHRPTIDKLATAEAYEVAYNHIYRVYAVANGKLAEGTDH